MRINSTQAEEILWRALRDRRLASFKFRRQKFMGPFIADFYCASARLVIEVDGDIHDYQKAYDDTRTRQFEAFGYRIIRFMNELVLNDLETVLSQIKAIAFERISTINPKTLTPTPSPSAGSGEQVSVSYLQSDCAESSADSGNGDASLTLEPGERAGE
jgi:5-methyltetrahydrofolate--homocysteine methyltransferase